jgi:hypothetical protein
MSKHVVLPLFLAIVVLAGCTHLTVRHLQRQPWVLEQSQELITKFWRFDYQVSPKNSHFVVRGKAYPLDSVPEWADSIRDLWLTAYLADENSHVIADDIRVYGPQALDREDGLDFEFSLRPDGLGSGDRLYLSFGYRMVLARDVAAEPGESPDQDVFFASEGALTQ